VGVVVLLVVMALGAASVSAAPASKTKRAAYDSPKLDPIPPALRAPTARAATDDDIPGVAIPASPFSDSVSSTTDLDDVFSIALTAGQTLTVALVGPTGSQFNMYLYAPGTVSVKNPDTPYVAVAVGTTYPCSFSYTATQSGTYYLDVYAKTGAGSYSVAYSVTSGPPTAVSLSLHATSSLIVPFAGSVDLEGAIRDASSGALVPNLEVTLAFSQEDKQGGEWTRLDTATSSTGEYSLGASNIQRLTYFALIFEPDGEIFWSNLVKVMAHAKLTPPAVPSRVRAGVPFTSWGTLKPLHTAKQNKQGHTKITFERKVNGRYRFVKTITASRYRNTSSKTQFGVDLFFPPFVTDGGWRIQAVHQDGDHVKSFSSWRTFIVR